MWMILFCAFAANAGAHIPAGEYFYKSPTSQFASGQAAKDALDKSKLQTKTNIQYQVKWQKLSLSTEAKYFLTDTQLASKAQTGSSAQLLDSPNPEATIKQSLDANENLLIVSADAYWAQVIHSKSGVLGFIPIHLLKFSDEDSGIFMPVIDSLLKDAPNGKIITTVPRNSRLIPISIESNGWIKVRYQEYSGFLDSRHLIGRADFAHWAWTEKKKWELVAYRDGTEIVLKSNERIPLNKIKAFHSSANRGIVIDSTSGLPLTSRVEILDKKFSIWIQSILPKHGLVWWKKDLSKPLAESSQGKAKGEFLTSEELFARPIFSYALSEGKQIQGIASSQGIWATTDGERWNKLPQFGNNDHPVALGKNGKWYVGAFESTSPIQGFEPYIRWDKLAHQIQKELSHSPKYMKLQKIEPLKDSRVQITVDTGIKRVKLLL